MEEEVFDFEFDLYTELEVSSNSSFEEIKASYQRMIMLYHPDKQKNSDKQGDEQCGAEKFLKIRTAWTLLSHADKRMRYDAFRSMKLIQCNQSVISEEVSLEDFTQKIEDGGVVFSLLCRCGDSYEVARHLYSIFFRPLKLYEDNKSALIFFTFKRFIRMS